MARAQAALAVVHAADAGKPQHILHDLFAREADLLEQLGKVRASIDLQRQRYARQEGLLVRPTVEALRRQFA